MKCSLKLLTSSVSPCAWAMLDAASASSCITRSQNPSLLSLLGAAGGAEPVIFITFGAAGGCWAAGGPFVSQNPSLLSLLVLLGAAGELGGGPFVSQNPSLLSLRVVVNWVWLQIERLYMHHRGK